MSTTIEVHISKCPNCGENRWLMEVPDDVAKKAHAKRVEDTPGATYRRGSVLGWLLTGGGVLSRLWVWRTLRRAENPPPLPSDSTIVCANCGHEMGLGADDAPHDWSLQ